MALIGDRFRVDTEVTADEITFAVTMRDTPWLIEAFIGALLTLTIPENWIDEYSDGLIDNARDYASELSESITMINRIGQINAYMVADASYLPAGVLPCTGATYDAADYPALFAVLPAGLKGADTFTTPDLRGRALIGDGTGTGLTPRVVASAVGQETHTLSEAEMPIHSHLYTPPVINVDLEAPGVPDIAAAGVSPVQVTTGTAGGGQAHNNMQPSYVAIWGIVAK